MVFSETSISMPSSPESIVSRIAAGEGEAEQELVNTYWRGLMYVLNRHTNNDNVLASDLAQDTFITVIKKARNSEITNPSALAAFIRQVGINLTIAHFRKQSVSRTDHCEDMELKFSSPVDGLNDKICQQELIDIVVQVMRELPTERDREILSCFYMEGETKRGLCDKFELSPEHFDRVLYRAKERLRQVLSVRLKIDVSQTNLTQLLSLLFVGTTSFFMTGEKDIRQQYEFQVRENYSTTHQNEYDSSNRDSVEMNIVLAGKGTRSNE